jgi:hypothetical protein
VGLPLVAGMAKKRTKEQKVKAQEERVAVSQKSDSSNTNVTGGASYTFTAQASSARTAPILANSTSSYVLHDLRKTAITAGMLFMVLVGIYIFLGYN